MKNFGIFLKYARKQVNLTQEQVAERLDIVTPVLSKWENDKANPPLDMLCKLCNVLNISIEECVAAEIFEGERVLPPEHYDAEKLGETVKQLRIKNGWSQAEVGKTLFVTSQTVSKWESGGISSLEVLDKLAELFGLTPTQLLYGLERMRAMPEKQTTAEQPKKSNRVVLRIAAIILGIIIFLGAIAGLITGLVLKYRDNQEQTELPALFCLPMQSDIYRTYLEYYVQNGFDGLDQHRGLDFSAEVGDSVYAVADGVVKKVISRVPNYFVSIEHGDGLVSVYWGVEAMEGIIEGSEVKKGELIGTISENPVDAELYDGPHLHFVMALNNVNVNPLEYLPYKKDNT